MILHDFSLSKTTTASETNPFDKIKKLKSPPAGNLNNLMDTNDNSISKNYVTYHTTSSRKLSTYFNDVKDGTDELCALPQTTYQDISILQSTSPTLKDKENIHDTKDENEQTYLSTESSY